MQVCNVEQIKWMNKINKAPRQYYWLNWINCFHRSFFPCQDCICYRTLRCLLFFFQISWFFFVSPFCTSLNSKTLMRKSFVCVSLCDALVELTFPYLNFVWFTSSLTRVLMSTKHPSVFLLFPISVYFFLGDSYVFQNLRNWRLYIKVIIGFLSN